ncbi:hypothetical protein F4819DRAFT_80790 [Hypoxylon fuscum]|nr:hypothetical protein F4819DRAFT_80790 [Hypoxylon fuscum]
MSSSNPSSSTTTTTTTTADVPTNLSASYENNSIATSSFETSPFHISKPLPLPLPLSNDPPTAAQKADYFRALRAAVADLQADVNSALTARMEARPPGGGGAGDKTDTKGGKGGAGKGVDDVAEEENYGEEVVEDDE